MRAGGLGDVEGRTLDDVLERLEAVDAALAAARTPEEAAEAVLVHGAAAVDADSAVLCRLRDDRRLEVVAARNHSAATLAVVESTPIDDLAVPLAVAARTGEPVLLEHDDAGGAIAALPLAAGGDIVGALGLGFARPRPLDATDRRILVGVANASAQALHRGLLHARAEESVSVLDAFVEAVPVGLALVDEALRFRFTNRYFTRMGASDAGALVDLARAVLAGDAAVVGHELHGIGSSGAVVLASGYPVAGPGGERRVGLVVTDVTAQRVDEARLRDESQIVETLHFVGRQLAGELDPARVLDAVTQAATLVTDAVAGAFLAGDTGAPDVLATAGDAAAFLGAVHPELVGPTLHAARTVRLDDAGGRVGPGATSFLGVPVTARDGRTHGGLFLVHDRSGAFDDRDERLVVGIAAQAAVALDDARLYQDEREARQRLALLAEAGRVLASSFDVDTLLSRVAAVVVPALADGCTISVAVDADPASHRAAVSVGDVAATAASTLVEVPLEARERPIGRLSLTLGPDRGVPGDDDMEVLADLGRRIAVAVENARLFVHQRSVAVELQRSLLPDRLPPVAGVEMAARYLPGGLDVDVGGDWYDVLPFPDGTVGMAMGDVVGRGVRAAALMGQLRSALRAYALEGHTPGACLSRLDVLLDAITGGTLVTAVKGHLDPRTGRLVLANAGHPPMLVLHPGGEAEYVGAAIGVPLSTLTDARYDDITVDLAPGDLVALYTDGLVEVREESLDIGFARLLDAFRSGPVDDLEALCDHVLAEMLGDRSARDDTALLVVRLVPAAP